MKIIFAFLLLPFLLLGQDSLSTHLAEIEVTDNRLSIPFRENVRSITVINQEKINSIPGHSTVELIQHFAGIDVRQRGIHGVQSDLSLRGSTFDQVLVLIDGIPMIDPQTGHHSLNLPLTKDAIERIEIIKGSASRIYGPNAFAGAINIVTKNSLKESLSATVEAGSFGLRKGQITANLPTSGTSISLSTQAADGYKYNTDYQLTNGFVRQNWQTKNTYWKLMAGMTFRKFGANGFYASPKFKDQYEEIQTSITSLQMTTKLGNWKVTPRVYWRRNQDMYLFVRLKPEIYRNMHINNTLGAEINTTLKKGNYTTGIGLTLNQFYLRSNNLGKHNRRSIGLFVEERIQLFDNQLDIVPGFNLHYYNDYGVKFFPGLDIGWHFNRNTKLYANAGYTWRVPTFTDLYYVGPTNIGNTDLVPESALAIEIGTKYQPKNWQIEAAIFRRDGQNIIDWTKTNDTLKWHPNNYNQVITTGLETSIEWQPSRIPLTLSTNYTFLNSSFEAQEGHISKYALTNLRHQINTRLSVTLLRNGNLSMTYRWLQRVTLPDYDLLDTKFNWRFKHFSIFAQANNILDRRYTETNLVEMPGFWFSGGIRFRK